MTSRETCRLLIDPPAGGAWNMAVDEVLLESAAQDHRFTLRFYQWSEPTLSLGYFQRYGDRRQHPPSLACDCVRRSSGGGAILHDRELTYSIAVPPSHPLARHAQLLYDAMHQSLLGCLRDMGITDLALAEGSPACPEPFLCFHRRSTGDVLLGPHKVAGSAQRRRQGAVLQHGSILLAASRAAPELQGLYEWCGRLLDAPELAASWSRCLDSPLASKLVASELTASELQRANEAAERRFNHLQWIQRR